MRTSKFCSSTQKTRAGTAKECDNKHPANHDDTRGVAHLRTSAARGDQRQGGYVKAEHVIRIGRRPLPSRVNCRDRASRDMIAASPAQTPAIAKRGR